MLIALYQDHHELPGWGGKTNPFDIFRPEIHKDFPFEGPRILGKENGQEVITGNSTIKLEDVKYLFSFLSGLYAVEANNLMAHVSALCSCQIKDHGYWHYPKRVWVQITTQPNEFTDNGIPVVYDMVKRIKPEIKRVWGGDNGTHSPYGFFANEKFQDELADDPKMWTRFFVEQLNLDPKLKAAKEDFYAAKKLLEETRLAVSAIQMFGPDQLNPNINQKFNAC